MALPRRRTTRAPDDARPFPRAGDAVRVDEARERDAALTDRDWSVLPPGTVSRTVAAPSGELALIEAGDPSAPRVLLVPGATGSKEDFSLMLPLLVDAGHFVQSFDLAGQYHSASAGPENLRPPRRHYDHGLFVDDLLTVIERGMPDGGGGPAHLLGYSFAGTVASLVTARRPELVSSLVLLSTPPLPGSSFRGVSRIGGLSSVLTPRAEASLMIFGIEHNLIPVAPGRVEFVRSRFALTRRSSVDDIVALMSRTPDVRESLRSTGVPALVAVGAHDLWPLELHARFARDIGAALAVYDTGHGPCETAPHQLVRDLLELYRRASEG